MTNDEFLQQFGHFVEAPNGIKKLRVLILELAVQGKLAQQHSNDEPAAELLKRMTIEKEQLISDKKARNRPTLPSILPEEKRYELPLGWTWVRLGEIGDWGAGSTPNRKDSSYYGGVIPWFKSGELTGGHISVSEETVTEKALSECSLRLNKPGDVLIAMYGATIGKVAILDVVATTNQAVCACTPYTGLFNEFLLLLLKAYLHIFTGQGAGGAQPNISRIKIVNTVAAIAPLAEQLRIVAKANELMALCDELEAELMKRYATHQQLIRAVHYPLTETADTIGIQTAWHRVHKKFTNLYTTFESVQALRQTILQLAVQGKLVPQNTKDEPAWAALEKIAVEKEKLINNKSLKRGKHCSP